MIRFAILSEGIGDRLVLENLLVGFVTGFDDDEPALNPVWPPEALPGQTTPPPGGWTLLLQQLRDGTHEQALSFNDFVVIQVDTDVAEDKGFDVPITNLGPHEIRRAVVARLEREIGTKSMAACAGKLLFAIAVHATECWLLPLVFPDKSASAKAAKITGCEGAVNHALLKLKKESLAGALGAGHKDPKRYDEVSSEFRKAKKLRQAAPRNPSLNDFVEQLDACVTPQVHRDPNGAD